MAKNIFLKECIGDAFLLLFKTKHPNKLTAQDIANQAGVGRATYFRNFSSKEEVCTFALMTLWKRWTKEKIDSKTVSGNVHDFFEFNFVHRDIIKRIYEVNYQQTIHSAFFLILREYPSYNPLDVYLTQFTAYGLFGLLEEWVERDFKEGVDELSEFVEEHV